MDVLSTVVNFVLVALTLVVIWFAWQTVRESRKATKAARETVGALRDVTGAIGDLLEVSQRMATSSAVAAAAAEETVEAARQTVDVAKAARKADERDRLVRQLREIGQLAESAFWKAAAEDGARSLGGWRCVEQQFVAVALAGIGLDLRQCHELAGTSQAHAVMTYAVNARNEISAELRKLHADD